jgi:hypothetical protein
MQYRMYPRWFVPDGALDQGPFAGGNVVFEIRSPSGSVSLVRADGSEGVSHITTLGEQEFIRQFVVTGHAREVDAMPFNDPTEARLLRGERWIEAEVECLSLSGTAIRRAGNA